MNNKHLNVESRFINVNGIQLHIVEKGDGPAVLLLHGFPDSWYLWRNQIPAFVEAGFRVIAPDLRGFGESDKPEDPDSYEMPILVADVIGILDELNIEKVNLVGHDWGANVGWALASNHPERVNRFVTLTVGHPKATRTIRGNEKAWYTYLWQFKGVAEELFMKDNWSLFREFTRNHPETDKWIQELARPEALTAAFNWYRGNLSPQKGLVIPMEYSEVQAPTLGLFGVHDPYLEEGRMISSEKFVTSSWRYERVEHAGHWLQLDRPEYVNKLMLEFLQEK